MIRLLFPFVALLAVGTAHAQPDDAHRRAALNLVAALEMEQSFYDGVRVGLDATADTPSMDQMRPVMEAFFDRYITWDKVVDDYVDLYVETFTQTELEELAAFYESPLGQRLVEEQTRLVEQGAQIGQGLVQQHEAELMAMLMSAMEDDALDATPSKAVPRK